MDYVRHCPNGHERPATELVCEQILDDGNICQFPLHDIYPVSVAPAPPALKEPEPEPYQPASPPPPAPPEPPAPEILAGTCPNGHPVDEDDALCLTCGEIVAGHAPNPDPPPQNIGDWEILAPLPGPADEAELFLARAEHSPETVLLKYYRPGVEPDPAIYPALGRLEPGMAAALLGHGRLGARAFEVWEHIDRPTLDDLRSQFRPNPALLQEVAASLIRTLASFESFGLRHGGLKPAVVRVRSRLPLLLAITDFATANLAEFDVEIARIRQPSRYMAPEAIAEATTSASDWWSLGIILLELATDGACFAGVQDRAFLLHLVTRGVAVPKDLEPGWQELLRGLLTRDHGKRWKADEAMRWADGERGIRTAQDEPGAEAPQQGPSLPFKGTRYVSPAAFALAAAEEENWPQAAAILESGAVASWLEEIDPKSRRLTQLRKIAADINLAEDHRVALSLAALSEDLPLCERGEIIGPNWLLADPQKGGAWLAPAPQRHLRDLKRDKDRWLVQLAERADRVKARIRDLRLTLNAEQFAVLRLTASAATLDAQWRKKRELFPDAAAPALAAMFDRRMLTDEDMLLLLSVEAGAFKPREEVLREAEALAEAAGVPEFDREAAGALLRLPRADLADQLAERLPGFSRCGRPAVDEWVDRYRESNKRISLARAIVVLAVPEQDWREPPHQDYVRNVLGFLERKVLSGVQRGPLVQLKTSKSSARVDLVDLGGPKIREDVLKAIVTRREYDCGLTGRSRPEQPVVDRLRRLDSQARTYRRDTGVNALMLGYPILTLKEAKSDGASAVKIAPVLLWPLKISIQAGATGAVKFGFDTEREVQLNPVLDTILGADVCARWQLLAEQLLQGGIADASDVLTAFEEVAPLAGGATVAPIPKATAAGKAGQPQLHSAAVLFLADFASQAIVEDLRHLQKRPLEATALECLFRLKDAEFPPPPRRPSEAERFSTLEADPSQERAVLSARSAPGLVLQGPPGTGKSQTIVNVVADCLGRGETVLVVCEKQAALEVVHKRLSAEGLDHRVFRVENTVSDRAKILKALQAQVPPLLHQNDRYATARQGRRLELAARIDQTEADLDAYHEAIYAPHRRLGYAYRDVLSRIATESTRTGGLAAPALRNILGPLDPGRLEAAVGECAGLVDAWIDGHVDGSPLAVFAAFPVDAGLAERIAEDFRFWQACETRRADAIAAYRRPGSASDRPLPVADPRPAADWLRAHAAALSATGPEILACVVAWQPLFSANGPRRAAGAEQRRALASLLDRLSRLSAPGWAAAFAPYAKVLDQRSLALAARRGVHFQPAKSLFEQMSPVRLAARVTARAAMRKLGLPLDEASCAAFAQAARLERETRKAASKLHQISQALGIDHSGEASDLRSVIRKAKSLAADLDRFEAFARRLDACPLAGEAWRAAFDAEFEIDGGAPPTAFAAFLERLVQATAVAETRMAAGSAFAAIKPCIDARSAQECAADIAEDRPQRLPLAAIEAALPHLLAYQAFRLRSRALSPAAAAVFAALGPLATRLRDLDPRGRRDALAALLRCEAARQWKQEIENDFPQLLQMRQQIDERVAHLSDLDAKMRDANLKVLAHVDGRQLSSLQSWTPLWPLSGGNSKRLRQVVEQGRGLGLFKLRPVWLVNPDVVSRMFPLDAGLFDVVIFDEASQMRVANAVPALFRARRCIVSGDDKQLPPTSFFGSRLDSGEQDEDDDDWVDTDTGDAEAESAERSRRQLSESRRHVKDCEDLLALSRGLLPQASLDIHYRSAYRELIAFSNAAYYDGRLNVPVRRPSAEVAKFKPIELHRVDGVYSAQTNPDEAAAVVDYLGRLWRENPAPPTIGVVTFNMKQADLIRAELAKRADSDRNFGKAFERESSRKDRDEDVGFFVKNLENVQGDERDWVLFSTTFGRDEDGVFKRVFGALGQQGGERRLNVAVTRAKQKVLLFTSMPTSDVSTLLGGRREPNLARDYLQAYLRYCELVDAGDFAEAMTLLNVFPRGDQPADHGGMREPDPLVDDALDLLWRHGFDACSMPADDAFAMDIAVTHPATGLYALGIEFDAPRHALLASARAREIWRPKLLLRSGMRLHRVVSAAWVQDPAGERERLLQAAREATEAQA
ncbi:MULTISPECIES: AAA domain-containing protein [Rhodomicrobium]|uniref:AAA domain-containing protein n=1 Tax=Rhodomicrobium TaxID=1068 RepID=UPI000B4C0F1E|nr:MULTISPECIES: AAA domain-containing protein [Rhodomicrobium]